ncbi:MAG: Hsp20/alpha crystallin family protein [Terricaulis sp.]
MRDLIPWGRSRAPARQGEPHHDATLSPFFTLRREMDRLFDDAFRGFGLTGFDQNIGWPQVDVVERDKEVRVTAELPGLEEKDIELRVEDNVLILAGEKRHEHDDEERRYSERYYGRFERRLALPAEVDDERAEARFRNGVLTVTLPKIAREQSRRKRIAISH